MIVPDTYLKKMVADGFLPENVKIGPSSVDLTLGDSFSWPNPSQQKIVLGEHVEYQSTTSNCYELAPNHFVLATTQERIRIPDDMAAYVEGRSSIGRLGLQVQNAGFIDAGFVGQITLELENQSPFPIVLQPGVRICQIVFVKMLETAANPYAGKYLEQDGATPSRLDRDPEFRAK
jgi:dCTP deaminase